MVAGKAVHDRGICEIKDPDAIHRLAGVITRSAAPIGSWSATL